MGSGGPQSFGPLAVIASQTKPGQVQRGSEGVVAEFLGRKRGGGFRRDFLSEAVHGGGVIRSGLEDNRGPIAPATQAVAVGGDVAARVIREREVSQKEPVRVQAFDSIKRLFP